MPTPTPAMIPIVLKPEVAPEPATPAEAAAASAAMDMAGETVKTENRQTRTIIPNFFALIALPLLFTLNSEH